MHTEPNTSNFPCRAHHYQTLGVSIKSWLGERCMTQFQKRLFSIIVEDELSPLNLAIPRLPNYVVFSDSPSEKKCKFVLTKLGYDLSLQGTRYGYTFVLRQRLPPGWKFLTGVIGRCL